MMTTAELPRLAVSRLQAAEICGCSVELIDQGIHAGTLRAKKHAPRNGKILIRLTDLEAWFDGLEDA
ncbi:MAG: hypothetical protein ACRDRL_29165 [Sciscionella sp.]